MKIPVLLNDPTVSEAADAFDERVRRVARAVPHINLDMSIGTRARYSYDASNYRVLPAGVAFPEDAGQIQQLLRRCAETALPVTVRGGGTSMAGNAIGQGLIIDMSRHLNRVLEIDLQRRTATVEPGVVLDLLNERLSDTGLVFAPDPSSRSRATIAGMVGNDACGNHSVRWGRTSQHIKTLDVALMDGTLLRLGPDGAQALEPGDEDAVARAAVLTRELRSLASDNLAVIRTELGRIERQVSGYHLEQLLPENRMNVARALVGSEGTCAVVLRVTVTLVEQPAATSLLVLGYRDIVDAATDVPVILPFEPTAIEGIDQAIVAAMIDRRGPDSVTALPQGSAWLFVELDGEDDEEVQAKTVELFEKLKSHGRLIEGLVVESAAARRDLWRVREDGAGLSTRPNPSTQTWAGWEDSAVSPQRLPEYLRDLENLIQRHGLTGVMYGHFGAGCIHVRLDFDLASTEGRTAMTAFVREAADLVVSHGGSLSGEHGDGRARSELLATMYSPKMVDLFAKFRRAFDPQHLLNPGIIVDPRPIDENLIPLPELSAVPGQPLPVFAYPHDSDFAGAVQRCVGVGRCRSDHGGFMCPSYRATHDEKDSTRGRARVLQAMVAGELSSDSWGSQAVDDAMDLCLSCKACSSDCPVGVDMATYKSEYLQRRYRGVLRPRSHYSLGWLPRWLSVTSRAPWLFNVPLRIPLLRRLAALLGGVTTRRSLPTFVSRRRTRIDDPDTDPDVLIFMDSFTKGLRAGLAQDAAIVLRDAGMAVAPAPETCCALTWITTGQLDSAKRILEATASKLDASGDIPIVVLEPSCAAALKKDLPELVDTAAARRVAGRITTFPQAVESALDLGWTPPVLPKQVLTQTHCHQHSVFGATSGTRVLRRLGIEPTEAEGCCGLAGNFGFEAEHYETSMAVAAHDLSGKIRSLQGRPALADGFSCHTQIRHVSEGTVEPQHLAQLISNALGERTTKASPPKDGGPTH